MPTLKIDNQDITVEKGTTVIQAAEKLGFVIPRYCYHPGLSIAGNCRMCLVEVEKMPKLQISCHIQCADGMVVNTETERVKKTRQHVLEFLLVNHPLDCPVCDQSGECWLQDYYMEHGLYESRLDEPKVKKQKAVPIGPTVMLDSERCILCSRCVRFCDEITKTNEFGIFNRGDHSEIGLYPGKELNNKYSGNVVDICPVGALTDIDFRFKCRVWYLRKVDSVCNGCSRGCNITLEVNTERPQHGHGERVMRIKPRYQPEINQWWICDEGRYGYKPIDHGRILEPARRSSGPPEIISWEDAITETVSGFQRFSKRSKEIAILLSPQLSNESLYLAKKLFSEKLGLDQIYLLSPSLEGSQDDFLIQADKNPNRKGAEILGFSEKESRIQELMDLVSSGKLKGLYLFGQDLVSIFTHRNMSEALRKLEFLVFQGTNSNLTSKMCHLILPSASYAETEGTFTNFEGKVQKFSQALLPIGDSRADVEIICQLARKLDFDWPYFNTEDVASEMQKKVPAFQNILASAPAFQEPFEEKVSK